MAIAANMVLAIGNGRRNFGDGVCCRSLRHARSLVHLACLKEVDTANSYILTAEFDFVEIKWLAALRCSVHCDNWPLYSKRMSGVRIIARTSIRYLYDYRVDGNTSESVPEKPMHSMYLRSSPR